MIKSVPSSNETQNIANPQEWLLNHIEEAKSSIVRDEIHKYTSQLNEFIVDFKNLLATANKASRTKSSHDMAFEILHHPALQFDIEWYICGVTTAAKISSKEENQELVISHIINILKRGMQPETEKFMFTLTNMPKRFKQRLAAALAENITSFKQDLSVELYAKNLLFISSTHLNQQLNNFRNCLNKQGLLDSTEFNYKFNAATLNWLWKNNDPSINLESLRRFASFDFSQSDISQEDVQEFKKLISALSLLPDQLEAAVLPNQKFKVIATRIINACDNNYSWFNQKSKPLKFKISVDKADDIFLTIEFKHGKYWVYNPAEAYPEFSFGKTDTDKQIFDKHICNCCMRLGIDMESNSARLTQLIGNAELQLPMRSASVPLFRSLSSSNDLLTQGRPATASPTLEISEGRGTPVLFSNTSSNKRSSYPRFDDEQKERNALKISEIERKVREKKKARDAANWELRLHALAQDELPLGGIFAGKKRVGAPKPM